MIKFILTLIPVLFAAAAVVPAAAQTPRPTIVLVHGAFADGSSWSPVMKRLQADGYPVIAAANPLRSLAADSDAVAGLLKTIKGTIVLVGHSYGGMVISLGMLTFAFRRPPTHSWLTAPTRSRSLWSKAAPT
jgi:pimeloyl-ACP methyl ester carboxylesterase